MRLISTEGQEEYFISGFMNCK